MEEVECSGVLYKQPNTFLFNNKLFVYFCRITEFEAGATEANNL